MKKGFLLSSSSSSSSKVVNERNKNKTSSVILSDDQSQSQKSSSNHVSNALLDLEEDTINKGLSQYAGLHAFNEYIQHQNALIDLEEDTINKALSQKVRMPGEMPPDKLDEDEEDNDDEEENDQGAPCADTLQDLLRTVRNNYEQDGGVDEGTAVVSIQRQRRLDRMSVRRQTTNNYSLAQQHQHQLRQQQQFRQEQNREQHREARAEMTPEQLENRREQDREQHREARAEMTPEQLENRQEQVREQHCQARAAEGVQIAEEVNNKGETFSIDMIGRPTANQLEGFEFDEDKALLLWYENAHDHVNDLISELDDCKIGEGWRWQPLSKVCVCHGGPLACSTRPQWHTR